MQNGKKYSKHVVLNIIEEVSMNNSGLINVRKYIMRRIPFFHREDKRLLSVPVREYPKVYNKAGEALRLFFVKDQIMDPYCGSRYFMWDRCNYGLDIHFYSHNNMLSTQGKPIKKYGILVESRQIVPSHYRIFDKRKGLSEEFDAIFTYDENLLNSLPNAKFFPACARVWYGKRGEEFIWDDECYQQKSKSVSVLSSDKEMCEMHKIRIDISKYCKKRGIADTFGTFDGGRYCLVDDTLKEYRYSIVIENDVSDYFFSEKITNCFAAQTIPVYLGARKIGDFFNSDGIIQISKEQLENLDELLKICTSEYYEAHISAILDNYRRVYDYRNVFDWMYENYFLNQKKGEI